MENNTNDGTQQQQEQKLQHQDESNPRQSSVQQRVPPMVAQQEMYEGWNQSMYYNPEMVYHTGAMNNPPMQHSMQRNSDPLETVLGPFPCVRIRGLPFDSNLEDVLVFFQGLVVLDVVVLPHSYNHQGTVGEAFVVFGNPMDFQMALQRNRLSMGNNYLEVYQGKRADYYAAVSSSMQKYNAHRVDEIGEGGSIYDAQQGWSVSGGHHNANPSQVLRAPLMQDMNKIAGGGTTHQLHHSYSKGVMPMPTTGNRGGRGPGDSIRPKGGAGRGSGRGGGIQIGEHTGFLRMRGLPFTAAKGEIFDFFKKYDPILESICLTYRSDGRATGEGYIAFVKPEDAQDAMELHRNIMGSRYIELFISNKEEHGRAHAREASTLR